MNILPDDHDWQTFQNLPRHAEDYLGHNLVTLHRRRTEALRQFENASTPIRKIEALQMIMVLSEAIGLNRHADVPRLQDKHAEAVAKARDRRVSEVFDLLQKAF